MKTIVIEIVYKAGFCNKKRMITINFHTGYGMTFATVNNVELSMLNAASLSLHKHGWSQRQNLIVIQ